MKFEEAVRKSIKAYFEGRDPEKFLEAHGEIQYTREYFDEVEEEMLSDTKKKTMKKDKEEGEDEDAIA
jgi:hypothetical protein